MKPCVSSSGCEPRPVRGQPTHAGSEPCGDRGNAVAARRRYASEWAVGLAASKQRLPGCPGPHAA